MALQNLERTLQNAALKLRSGKPAAAAKAAKAALKKFPNEPRLLDLAGVAAQEAGDLKAAVSTFLALHKLKLQDKDVRYKLGIALAQSDAAPLAEKILGSWVNEEPENPTFRFLSALNAISREEYKKAEAEAALALSQNPKMERALAIRGLARFEMSRFDSALEDFEQARAIDPENAETLLNIGLCQRALRQTQKAIAAFRACISLTPGSIEAHVNLAEALEQSGELDEAKSVYQRVLEAAPAHLPALSRMVALNSGDQNRALEAQVQHANSAVRKNSDDAVTATNVLADLLVSIGKKEEAEAFYARSNALAAMRRPYDQAAAEADFDTTMRMFPLPHQIAHSGDTDRPKPILIIGQPRSGTTLLELMLTGNKTVLSLGEFGAIEDPALLALQTGTFEPLEHATAFRAQLPARAAGFDALIDKTPANYRFVGFLAEAFADARFVHLERDPRDVALSMWKIHFKGGFYTYASRLDWMAHAANLYRRYMNAWQERYGSRIIKVHYRDLVQNPEATVKNIADFCGLDWVEDMASPERSTATIETASILQARKPVHAKSLDKWVAHKEFLQPFMAELDPTLWPEVFEDR